MKRTRRPAYVALTAGSGRPSASSQEVATQRMAREGAYAKRAQGKAHGVHPRVHECMCTPAGTRATARPCKPSEHMGGGATLEDLREKSDW
jgi:hypothetical protein